MTKSSKAPSITNLIGALLIIVALVSAGGLFYIASEYSKISETYVSVESYISNVAIVRNNETGIYNVTVSIVIDNPSPLDIEIYRIEYLTHADFDTITLTEYDRDIGGSQTNKNNTVSSNSMLEMQVSHKVYPGSIYAQRLEYAMNGGNITWIYVGGFVWFRISEYQDVMQSLGIGNFYSVEVQNA